MRELFLTHLALEDIRALYEDSVRAWGERVADNYIRDIQAVLEKVTAKPDLGKLRSRRIAPYKMVAARQHFIVYDDSKNRITILAVLHQRSHVESIVHTMEAEFIKAVKELK